MDQVTQENAALVEESAAAAQALRDQATQLTDMVAAFKLDDTSTLDRWQTAHAPRGASAAGALNVRPQPLLLGS